MVKKYAAIILFLFTVLSAPAQTDQELNRDSVIGWQYISNPVNTRAVYKPIKSQYANGATYSAWQQKASDMLLSWIQQSYLPRGLVIRTIVKNDQRWHLFENGPLHSYGVGFLGYAAHFVNGKIDLHCCEQGQRLFIGVNDFPGKYIAGFNPGGIYFFAEQASFTTGDDDAQLSKEGIDKKIQPSLHGYRTYLDHYHDKGLPVFNAGVVIPKNGEWPFKPVLVKEAVACIQQQLAAFPSIFQKNPYSVAPFKSALERLRPYYDEVAKLKGNANFSSQLMDDNGHAVLDPSSIINGNPNNKTFPEYYVLVSTTQQTINQAKTDDPMWVYLNFTPPDHPITGNPVPLDTRFVTDQSHLVYSLLNNFNFDYVARWLAQANERESMVYTSVKEPVRTAGNTMAVPIALSSTAAEKRKDPATILYEDFDGYPTGQLSAKGWHTYGHDGHDFANPVIRIISGQSAKWVSIPDQFSFFPDFNRTLTSSFTINYDVYFGKDVKNNRSAMYFRLDALDPNPAKNGPIDLHDMNREGFQFSISMNGETETSNRFMSVSYKEAIGNVKIPATSPDEVSHVSISVNGAVVTVSVNGKELMRNEHALPAGKSFKRYGWYCGVTGISLGRIYLKAGM